MCEACGASKVSVDMPTHERILKQAREHLQKRKQKNGNDQREPEKEKAKGNDSDEQEAQREAPTASHELQFLFFAYATLLEFGVQSPFVLSYL